MHILVTGAAGRLGHKLSTHLTAAGHVVTGLDRKSEVNGHNLAILADLSHYCETWARRFSGQDVVIHLAAQSRPYADWASVIPDNVDAALNVFEAASRNHVPRVVFASSSWAMRGHRFSDAPLAADTVPHPVEPYGMSKLMGERIGAHFAAAHGMTVIATRIGFVQPTHGNQPGPHMDLGRWGQNMWLSDEDFLTGMTAAATVPATGFSILNLMSNNPGMRWSLNQTREVLGFSPQDGAAAALPPSVRFKDLRAYLREIGIPKFVRAITGRT